MKKIILYLLLFFTIGTPVMVIAAESVKKSTPSPSVVVAQISPIPTTNSEVQHLQDQVDKIRDENYQHAIKSAEQTGEKANNLINIVVGLATIFGFILTAASVIFGGNIFKLIRKLDAQVARAKKGADFIDKLSSEAKSIQSKLKQERTDLDKKLKELEILESGKSKDRKDIETIKVKIAEIQKITAQAQGTFSELQALQNSARYVSGTTGSNINLGDIGVSGDYGGYAGISLANRVCKYCGRSEQEFVNPYSGAVSVAEPIGPMGLSGPTLGSQILDDYVCPTCRSLGRS